MTRRGFITFFLLGGFVGIFSRKIGSSTKPKEAMFWRKAK